MQSGMFTNDDVQADYSACRYVFTGREYDAETRIYFYRARYYVCELGRFLGRDSRGYSDGPGLYQMVRSIPSALLDPFGLAIVVQSNSPFPNAGMTAGLGDSALKALQELCPCVTLLGTSSLDGSAMRIELRQWNKGGKRYPYDPDDAAAKKKFCDCFNPSPEVLKTLQAAQAFTSTTPGITAKAAAELNAVKGYRGNASSCAFVIKALTRAEDFKVQGSKGQDTTPTSGKYIGIVFWNPTHTVSGGGPTTNLGHELFHRVQNIGGGKIPGTQNELTVSTYENIFRFERGVNIREEYTGTEIMSQGDPIIRLFAERCNDCD
jgi:RHS repeat-associated protein